jgi:uncharacterized protein (DUF433 family)
MTQKYIERGWDYQVDIGIDSKPGRCGGAPCIAGTRIRIDSVRGWTAEEMHRTWPHLTDKQVAAAVRYWEVRSREHCT